MKSLVRALLSSAGLLAAVSASAALNPALVSADARWLVHADLNALRRTALGQELASAIQKAQAGATAGTIGLDVAKALTTLGTFTAYGTNLTPDPKDIDGALIAQGTADLRKIAESLLLQGTIAEPKVFAEVTDLPFPAYAIGSPPAPGSAPKMELIIAFPPEPMIVLSKSRVQLLKALEVVRGNAPSLARSPGSPLGRFAAGATDAYLFAASVVPAEAMFPENAPQTRMLRLAQAGAIALGERGENTFAHAELLASSATNADKLTKILQGMTAALSLAETTDQQLAEFINATSVTRAGDTVKLDLAYSSARLTAMAQSLRASMEKPAPRAPEAPAPTPSARIIAEWTATASDPAGSDPTPATHTIENVALENGSTITLNWRPNGGRGTRPHRVEITPAQGGAPLVFRSDMMRSGNNRGAITAHFQFPGADGAYTLKIAYANDPAGKAAYAVSVRAPRPAVSETK